LGADKNLQDPSSLKYNSQFIYVFNQKFCKFEAFYEI